MYLSDNRIIAQQGEASFEMVDGAGHTRGVVNAS